MKTLIGAIILVMVSAIHADDNGLPQPKGEGNRFKLVGEPVALSDSWRINDCPGVTQRVEGDVLAVEFGAAAGDVNYYHAKKLLAAETNTGYRLTGWIRTEGLPSDNNGTSFQIGDERQKIGVSP